MIFKKWGAIVAIVAHDSSTLTFKIERNCLTINNQIRQGFIDLVFSDGRPNSFFPFISQAHGVFYAMHPGVKFLERDETQTLRQGWYTIPYHPGTTPDHIIPHYAKPHYTTSHHTTTHYTNPTKPYHIASHRTTPHHTKPYPIITTSHHITSHHTTPHHTTPHHTTPHHTTPHHTTPHHTTPHHTTPHHTTPHHTTPHHTTPHHTTIII